MRIDTLLSIAVRHLELAKIKDPSYYRTMGDEHWEALVVVVVFSAAAIESQINFMLTLPGLLINEESERDRFSRKAVKDQRPNRLKLENLATTYGEEDIFKNDRFKFIFDKRNDIVHPKARIIEGIPIPRNLSGGDGEEDRIMVPAVGQDDPSEEIQYDFAEKCFKEADAFYNECKELMRSGEALRRVYENHQ